MKAVSVEDFIERAKLGKMSNVLVILGPAHGNRDLRARLMRDRVPVISELGAVAGLRLRLIGISIDINGGTEWFRQAVRSRFLSGAEVMIVEFP
jgi:hypothetical protein